MQQLGVTKPARRREKFSLLPPAIYLVQMFFFARPPSCASFTRLLAFRVTRKSQRYNTRNLTFIFGALHSFGSSASRFRFFSPISRYKSSALTRLRTLRHRGKINSLTINQIHSFHDARGCLCDISVLSASRRCLLRCPDGARNMPLTPLPATHTKPLPVSPFAATHTKKRGVGVIIVNYLQPHSSTASRYNPLLNFTDRSLPNASLFPCTGVLANCGSRRSAESRTGREGRSGTAFPGLHL